MTAQQRAEQYVREKLPELKTRSEWSFSKDHPIQLQHWLRVLSTKYQTEVNFRSRPYAKATFIPPHLLPQGIMFDLTTGQPATEADYKAFCEIVGI